MKDKRNYSTLKVYGVTRQELKILLLDFSVNSEGKKVTKFELCKDKEFLKAIKSRKDEISLNTVQCWYKRLAKFEPLGIMTDKFIFDYHKNITERIGKDVSYYDWTTKKLNKEDRQEYDVKAVLGWNENKRLLALLKLNNPNFKIEKYSGLKLKDLRFMVNMYIPRNKMSELENKLNEMIKTGDESIVDLVL